MMTELTDTEKAEIKASGMAILNRLGFESPEHVQRVVSQMGITVQRVSSKAADRLLKAGKDKVQIEAKAA